jgi:hypothetical protein
MTRRVTRHAIVKSQKVKMLNTTSRKNTTRITNTIGRQVNHTRRLLSKINHQFINVSSTKKQSRQSRFKTRNIRVEKTTRNRQINAKSKSIPKQQNRNRQAPHSSQYVKQHSIAHTKVSTPSNTLPNQIIRNNNPQITQNIKTMKNQSNHVSYDPYISEEKLQKTLYATMKKLFDDLNSKHNPIQCGNSNQFETPLKNIQTIPIHVYSQPLSQQTVETPPPYSTNDLSHHYPYEMQQKSFSQPPPYQTHSHQLYANNTTQLYANNTTQSTTQNQQEILKPILEILSRHERELEKMNVSSQPININITTTPSAIPNIVQNVIPNTVQNTIPTTTQNTIQTILSTITNTGPNTTQTIVPNTAQNNKSQVETKQSPPPIVKLTPSVKPSLIEQRPARFQPKLVGKSSYQKTPENRYSQNLISQTEHDERLAAHLKILYEKIQSLEHKS